MAGTVAQLDSDIQQQVRKLCKQGYEFYDQGELKSAIRSFFQAWTLIPKPQNDWLEAGWVLTALGDAYFAKGDFHSGQEALRSALHCPETANNPFIHLRLAQCLFESNDVEQSQQHFSEVLNHGGAALLEKEDGKYREFVTALSE